MQFPISADMIRQGTVLLQKQQTQDFQCVSHKPCKNSKLWILQDAIHMQYKKQIKHLAKFAPQAI